jgi:hypothetical protein
MLGGHSSLIGLGEIAKVISEESLYLYQAPHSKHMCSCGKNINECTFWSKVLAGLKSQESKPYLEKYKIVMDIFHDTFGLDTIPVDSSKYIRNLNPLVKDNSFDIKALYLIKDVRNYTISQIDNIQRKNWNKNFIKKHPFYFFFAWHVENKVIQKNLITKNIDYFQLGYEELCLHLDSAIENICKFLEIESEPAMYNIKESTSHVVRGNRIRNLSGEQPISYDHRWFNRRDWLMASLLFRHIMKFNQKHVYRNKFGE